MDEDMLDAARQVAEYLSRRAALLDLLRGGYIDQEILDLFWTGDDGFRLLPRDLN